MRRAFLAAATLVLLSIVATASTKVQVKVDYWSKRSDALPANFASFSVEIPCLKWMVFEEIAGPNSTVRGSYVNLLSFLRDVGGMRTGPNIRVGGNSADVTYFSANGTADGKPPKGYTNLATNDDLLAMSHAPLWNGTITLDLNLLVSEDPSNAVSFAMAAQQIIPAVALERFEIGNEPELFKIKGYDYDQWQGNWTVFAKALQKAGVQMPFIQGAVFCCGQWDRFIPSYVDKYTNGTNNFLSSVSHHFYPLNGATATIPELMDAKSVDLTQFKTDAAATVAKGIPFLMGEGNSAYDGGREGVSNTFASTLWSIDVLFNAAATNMTRWNFHGCPTGPYTPIDTKSQAYAAARPLYYGMWAFTDAVQRNAHLIQADRWVRDMGKPSDAAANLSVWATRSDYNGRVAVVLIHKAANETAEAFDVLVEVGKECANKTARVRHGSPVSRMLNATAGVYFGNQTFEGSVEGTVLGVAAFESVPVDKNGFLTREVTVDPVSFVIVDVEWCH
jgi:hypothetical protein